MSVVSESLKRPAADARFACAGCHEVLTGGRIVDAGPEGWLCEPCAAEKAFGPAAVGYRPSLVRERLNEPE